MTLSEVSDERAARSVMAAVAGPARSTTGTAVTMAATTASRARSERVGSRSAGACRDDAQDGACTHGPEQIDRLPLGDLEAAGQRDAGDAPPQHFDPRRDSCRWRARFSIAAHDGEDAGSASPKATCVLPAIAQILHRIRMSRQRRLALHVSRQAMLGDGIEQPALVRRTGDRSSGPGPQRRRRRRGW